MDQLAHALIDLSGLTVTNSQAREIEQLYDALFPYTTISPWSSVPSPRGQAEGASVDHMER